MRRNLFVRTEVAAIVPPAAAAIREQVTRGSDPLSLAGASGFLLPDSRDDRRGTSVFVRSWTSRRSLPILSASWDRKSTAVLCSSGETGGSNPLKGSSLRCDTPTDGRAFSAVC
jgi:hypothetical protein